VIGWSNGKNIINKMSLSNPLYNILISKIGESVQNAKTNAYKAINNELIQANWQIGKHIVEYEQNGKSKAEYGSALLSKLSIDLKIRFGKGFGKSNIYLCRQFYLQYPIFRTVSGKLSWSHYAELLTVSDELAKTFYEKQCRAENWSFRELKRQINSALFERLALSKNKKGVLKLAQKGQEINTPEDTIKDPYIFEFLNLPSQKIIKEKDLEKKLIDNLQSFLLELGK
jgi:DUF1016 N-terminal domain/YhcG PDDEXK nuclease domain